MTLNIAAIIKSLAILYQNTVRDLEKSVPQKREIRVPFRAPLFLGKWYEVAIYLIYTKTKEKKYMTELFSLLIE